MTLDEELDRMSDRKDDHDNKTKKSKFGLLLKTSLLGLSMAGSAYLGDHYSVNDRIVNPLIYHNKETAEYFTEHPFDLEKEIKVNEDGKLETYFGPRGSEDLLRVRENNHTAGTLDDIYDGSRRHLDSVKEYLEENFF